MAGTRGRTPAHRLPVADRRGLTKRFRGTHHHVHSGVHPDSPLHARGGGADDAFQRGRARTCTTTHGPSLSLAWRDDPAYPAAFAGADVVIFDSSRSHTAPLGPTEDASDDWVSHVDLPE